LDIVAGLDLGKSTDPTALAALERSPSPGGKNVYRLGYLSRWPLHTPYVSPDPARQAGIADDLAVLLSFPPLKGALLAVDGTGVGAGVVDVFRTFRLPCALFPVVITGGRGWSLEKDGSFRVAKVELVSTLQLLLGTGRVQVAPALPLARVLLDEFRGFTARLTSAGNEVYEHREGAHDDILLAVAMALWLGEHVPAFTRQSIGVGKPATRFDPDPLRRMPEHLRGR
jgi:hypothetical protein